MFKFFKKNKKTENRVFLPPTAKIKVERFTKASWVRGGFGTEQDYTKKNIPDNLFDFLVNACIESDIVRRLPDDTLMLYYADENIPVTPVVIDEEYYDQLNGSDTQETMTAYIDNVSDEDVVHLLKKHKLNRVFSLWSIALIVNFPTPPTVNTDFKLVKDSEKVKEQLETIFGKGRVYLPGYVCFPEELYHCQSDFLNLAKTYFDEGINVSLSKYDIQRFDLQNKREMYFLLIPFVVDYEYNKPNITLKELIGDAPLEDEYKLCSDLIKFDELANIGLYQEDVNFQANFSFRKTGIDTIIRNVFPADMDVTLCPYWFDINNFIREADTMEYILFGNEFEEEGNYDNNVQ